MSEIIKAHGMSRGGVAIRRTEFNFDDMAVKADVYLDEVRRQAAHIVEKAHRDAEQVRKAAQEQGRQDAMQAAEAALRTRVEQQLGTLLPALDAAVKSIRDAQGAWLRQSEKDVVHLATEIARKILRRELAKQPEVALDAVREALELAAGARRIQVHLAPDDHETLSDQVRQLAAAIQPLAAAEILPDAEISPGGCRLTTEFGPIDMQIETQLARIEQELA